MSLPLAEYILDAVSAALQDTSHRRHPQSALRGFDIVQICTACKLRVANEFLISRAVAQIRPDAEKRFLDGIRLYDSLPWQISMTFVADDEIDSISAKSAFEIIDPSSTKIRDEFAREETADSLAIFCKSVENDPLYWQKIYTRLGLEYNSSSPNGSVPVEPTWDANDASIAAHFFKIVSNFIEVVQDAPLIADSRTLRYPKRTILYAIQWLRHHYEDVSESCDDEARETLSKFMPSLAFLLTILADRWHVIDPKDRDAISRMQRLDAWPDWAAEIREKYIDEDRASNEAAEAAFEVMKDRVNAERSTN